MEFHQPPSTEIFDDSPYPKISIYFCEKMR